MFYLCSHDLSLVRGKNVFAVGKFQVKIFGVTKSSVILRRNTSIQSHITTPNSFLLCSSVFYPFDRSLGRDERGQSR